MSSKLEKEAMVSSIKINSRTQYSSIACCKVPADSRPTHSWLMSLTWEAKPVAAVLMSVRTPRCRELDPQLILRDLTEVAICSSKRFFRSRERRRLMLSVSVWDRDSMRISITANTPVSTGSSQLMLSREVILTSLAPAVPRMASTTVAVKLPVLNLLTAKKDLKPLLQAKEALSPHRFRDINNIWMLRKKVTSTASSLMSCSRSSIRSTVTRTWTLNLIILLKRVMLPKIRNQPSPCKHLHLSLSLNWHLKPTFPSLRSNWMKRERPARNFRAKSSRSRRSTQRFQVSLVSNRKLLNNESQKRKVSDNVMDNNKICM